MNERQQSPMRVGQGPHEAARFIRDIEIRPDFEAVQALKHQSERAKDEKGPPAEAKVPLCCGPGSGRSAVSYRAQGGDCNRGPKRVVLEVFACEFHCRGLVNALITALGTLTATVQKAH